MAEPKFAHTWYDTPSVYQLRQEILRIYELLSEREEAHEDLEERVEDLEP